MKKEQELKNLGLRVKELRKEKGLTQTELAHTIGKDHPSINRLEKGKINPSYIFLLEVAYGLEIDPRNFFPPSKDEEKE